MFEQGDFGKGFVHVLDDRSLSTVMGELDTVSDFVGYLSSEEALVTSGAISIVSPGEDDLLAIFRQLSFSDEMTERYASDITAFFGGEEWRAIRERRQTSADTPQLKAELVDLYATKLKTVWQFAGMQERVGRSERQRLYRMFFATHHPHGQRLADWQKGARQPDLFN